MLFVRINANVAVVTYVYILLYIVVVYSGNI